MKKALKNYKRINQYYKTKDAKNNSVALEDENTLDYRNGLEALDELRKKVLTNICVIYLKEKEWKEVVSYAQDVSPLSPYRIRPLISTISTQKPCI